jgi:acyl-CoA thioester hydrolase
MTLAFVYPINVRYLEVDQQGVVFNMWYLAYFDDAMTAFMASAGIPYATMKEAGLDLQLVHVDIDWKGGVGFGDEVGVRVRPVRVGTTSFTLGFEVLRSGQPVVGSRIVYVCVATDGSGKRELPSELRRALA